jgi:hypothetical protein
MKRFLDGSVIPWFAWCACPGAAPPTGGTPPDQGQVERDDEEWARLLNPEQYRILRREGAVHKRGEVRQWNRLAEFFPADSRRARVQARLSPGVAAHRIPLFPLRRPPRAPVRRRPGADRQAVLQQRGRADLRGGGALTPTPLPEGEGLISVSAGLHQRERG